MMPTPEIEQVQVGTTTYDIRDAYSIHTINEIAPDANGELATVMSLSIVNGKLCQTYTKEVDN